MRGKESFSFAQLACLMGGLSTAGLRVLGIAHGLRYSHNARECACEEHVISEMHLRGRMYEHVLVYARSRAMVSSGAKIGPCVVDCADQLQRQM